MRTTQKKWLSSTKSLLFLFTLILAQRSFILYAQPINLSNLLPTQGFPYARDVSPSLKMHNLSSQGIVLFDRPVPGQSPGSHRSTGFFIKTDPDKPYYCLLTSGHSIFGDQSSTNHKEESVDLNMSYRLTYINPGLVNSPNGNLQNYSVYAANMFATAKVLQGEYNSVDQKQMKDYAILGIMKQSVPLLVPIYQHGVEYISQFPEARLNDDKMKSAFIINHGEARPQLISTLTKGGFSEDPIKYDNVFAIQGIDRKLLDGSSGSPLLIPTDQTGNKATVIGILSGDNPLSNKFHNLNTIKSAIQQFCNKNEEKKDEYLLETRSIENKPIKNNLVVVQKILTTSRTAINDIALKPINSGKESIDRALKDMLSYVEKAKAVEILVDSKAAPEKIQQGALELDLKMTQVEASLGEVNHGITGIIDYTRSDLSSTLYSYFRDMMVDMAVYGVNNIYLNTAQASLINRQPRISYTTKNLEIINSIPLLINQLSAVQSGINYWAQQGVNVMGRRKRSAPPSVQMGIPLILLNLQNKIYTSAHSINYYLLNLKSHTSDNVDFFRGVEYFYSNREANSNRFLQKSFYDEEYLISDYIIKYIQIEIDKARASKDPDALFFANQCESQLSLIKSDLSLLKAKNYPQGFIVAYVKKVYTESSAYNESGSSVLTGNLKDLTWKSVGVKEGRNNRFGYTDMWSESPANNSHISDLIESYNDLACFHKSKVHTGDWFTTNFKIAFGLEFEDIAYTIDPTLDQYLGRNSLQLKSKKDVGIKPGYEKETISYDYIFDKTKLPKVGTPFVGGTFTIKDYIKTVTEKPQLTSSYYFGRLIYEIKSPEVLILARAVKEVTCDITGYSNENYSIQTNDNLGNALSLMKNYLLKAYSFKYRVELDANTAWEFDFPVTEPPVIPGQKYRIKSRASGNYLYLGNNSHLTEKVYASAPTNYFQLWYFNPNSDGSYSISKEQNSGTSFDIPYSTTTSGTQIMTYSLHGGLNQRWKISPSTTAGYYVISSMINSATPLRITSAADPRVDNNVLASTQNGMANQDWFFELSTNGAREGAVESVQPISAEETTVPTIQPNPVSDQLQLNLPDGYTQSTISISNTTGARMSPSIQRNENKWLIDVQNFPTGIYFITIQSDQKPKLTLKFLKK